MFRVCYGKLNSEKSKAVLQGRGFKPKFSIGLNWSEVALFLTALYLATDSDSEALASHRASDGIQWEAYGVIAKIQQ